MTDKLSDDDLAVIALKDSESGAMARELLTLRRREREARDLLKEAAFARDTYHERRFVWLSEGVEHE